MCISVRKGLLFDISIYGVLMMTVPSSEQIRFALTGLVRMRREEIASLSPWKAL